MNNGEKTKQRLELLLLSVMTLYFAVLAWYTPQYGSKARLFPTLVLAVAALLLILKWLSALLPKWRAALEPKEEAGMELYQEKEAAEEKPRPEKVPQTLAWLLLSAALFYIIGIVPAVFVSSLLFFLLITRLKGGWALFSAAAMTGFVYAVFELALKMRLYTGLWF